MKQVNRSTLLPEAFAVVREAGKRALGMRVFDVQMMGGIALHEGRIAEMRTGEGKTLLRHWLCISMRFLELVSTWSRSTTTLAKWGREWMKPLYEFLGMSSGVVYAGQSQEEKRRHTEPISLMAPTMSSGFDYLRDNMAFGAEDRVQRPLNLLLSTKLTRY